MVSKDIITNDNLISSAKTWNFINEITDFCQYKIILSTKFDIVGKLRFTNELLPTKLIFRG